LLLAISGGHNRSFLWEATRGNRVVLVKYLLKAGADPNVPGRIRSECVVLLKPYCIARRNRHTGLADVLLKAGTVIDIYSACYLGDIQRAQELLDAQPSLLAQEQEEDTVWRVTPLHYAVSGGNEKLADWLIKQGAKVKPYTRLLCNAAVRMGHSVIIPILLQGGADKKLARVWSQPLRARKT
jgi:hypothetical protein